jgi:hypothetical protein
MKDKLAAISGVARLCGPPDDYLAGIWRADLAYWLLWQSFGAKCFSEFVAPSWSWASMDGFVSFMGDLLVDRNDISSGEIYISLREACTTLSGANPFGAVSSGFLRLTGFPFRLSGTLTLCSKRQLGKHEIVIDLYLDDLLTYYLHFKTDYVFLPIKRLKASKIGGLLLESTNRVKGEYRRAGCFTFKCQDESEEPLVTRLEDILNVFGGELVGLNPEETEEKTGQSVDGLAQHVLSII